MLDRKIQDRQLSPEDAAFETKWQTSFRGDYDLATQFTIWKKFIATAPDILNRENYEEIPVKLWDEDFQLPRLKSPIHDNEIYSQDVESRQEFESHQLDEKIHPRTKTLSIEDIKHQLDIWSTRNLTIFFIEYLIDSEIKSLKILESGHSTDLASLTERIPSIENLYQQILKTLNTADYYITEPEIYDPTYNIHPKKFDIDTDCKYFRNIMHQLTMLGSSRQLELLKLKIKIESFGLLLPHSDEIVKLAALSDKQCQQEIDNILAANKLAAEQAKAAVMDAPSDVSESNNGSLRKSKRVTSHLHTLGDEDDQDEKDDDTELLLSDAAAPAASTTAARQPAASSLAKDILFGIVVGLAISILVAGVVAAIILSRGLALSPDVLGGIFSGIFGTGIVGGFFGGAMKSCCQPDAGHPPSAPGKTNNADLHDRLGVTNNPSSGAPRHIPPQGEKGGMSKDISRAPTPSASLTSQNLEKTTAPTRNGNRH